MRRFALTNSDLRLVTPMLAAWAWVRVTVLQVRDALTVAPCFYDGDDVTEDVRL